MVPAALFTVLLIAAGLTNVRIVEPTIGRFRMVHSHDWYNMLRIMGFMGTWGVVAAAFFFTDVTSRDPRQ